MVKVPNRLAWQKGLIICHGIRVVMVKGHNRLSWQKGPIGCHDKRAQ